MYWRAYMQFMYYNTFCTQRQPFTSYVPVHRTLCNAQRCAAASFISLSLALSLCPFLSGSAGYQFAICQSNTDVFFTAAAGCPLFRIFCTSTMLLLRVNEWAKLLSYILYNSTMPNKTVCTHTHTHHIRRHRREDDFQENRK